MNLNLSHRTLNLSDDLTSQARPSWTDTAAAAHRRCRPVQPAGGKAAVTPGRSDQGTPPEPAGPQPHGPHCCYTAGETKSGGKGRRVEAIYRTKRENMEVIHHIQMNHLLHKNLQCGGNGISNEMLCK